MRGAIVLSCSTRGFSVTPVCKGRGAYLIPTKCFVCSIFTHTHTHQKPQLLTYFVATGDAFKQQIDTEKHTQMKEMRVRGLCYLLCMCVCRKCECRSGWIRQGEHLILLRMYANKQPRKIALTKTLLSKCARFQ